MLKNTQSHWLKLSIEVTEGAQWNEILAIASIAIVPSVVIFLNAQNYFIEGIAGGTKG